MELEKYAEEHQETPQLRFVIDWLPGCVIPQ